MVEYNTVNTKLSNLQLTKLKTDVKNNQGTTFRMNTRMFSGNYLPHESCLKLKYLK